MLEARSVTQLPGKKKAALCTVWSSNLSDREKCRVQADTSVLPEQREEYDERDAASSSI